MTDEQTVVLGSSNFHPRVFLIQDEELDENMTI